MSDDLNARARFFQALSHPARLNLLRLTWAEALSGEHLARLLNLAPATVSHHLSLLAEAGLVSAEPSGHQRLFRANHAALNVPLDSLVRGVADVPPAEDPYRERVPRAFFKEGKLTQIPGQRKKRDVILRELANLFEPGERHSEKEVNGRLGEYHPDFFTLRRELVGLGLLERQSGVYWRPTVSESSS